ncbi:hypothetical protein [Alteromonas halophila]|uniref:Uncharacterized protein n=1 Tax=Alteromonas halophila TaxID=516698 RepID=A0A918JN72_9ALTE|nr:hypothetical protein [Alteromonas halophila]GGW91787.1 hypothetical protein GCM10007391_27540 [Alteromonas halophila]
MKASTLIIASVLTVGTFSGQAQANESGLDRFVSHLVAQTVSMTTNELENSARQLVANASHMFELDAATVSTRVSVTDLAAEKPEKETQDTGE